MLIYGASGSLGTYAIQLAKHYGAVVTGVSSGRNHDLVTSLGADKVVDYTIEDFTKTKERYDIVFDAVGKTSYVQCRRLLTDKGKYLTTNGIGKVTVDDFIFLRTLIESGTVKPVIDRIYPIDQIVDAHRYVDTGRKRGNVAIIVSK